MLNRREMISASAASLLAGSLRSAPLSVTAGQDISAGESYPGPAAGPDLPAFSSYSDLAQLLQQMRTNAATVRTRTGQFADAFTNQSGINAGASHYYDYDGRRVIGPQRTFKSTVAPEEPFDTIAGWTVKVGATVVRSRDQDPNIGNVAELDSGATPGHSASLRKYFGAIPATFGVSVLMELATASTSAGEALEIQVQNSQGHKLRMRLFSGAVQFFYNGRWNKQFSYGGSASTYTEWWFDTAHKGGSTYTIRLFAGTQELPGFTGNLPDGTPGENGWVGFIQHSATVPHRKGRIAVLQVGSSALPADMSLVSVARDVGSEPTAISMALMFEDVCLQTVINTDLKAWISKDAGTTWHQVRLVTYAKSGPGVLDATKPVFFVAGSVTLAASGAHSVCCRITSANGRYFSLDGYAWRVDA